MKSIIGRNCDPHLSGVCHEALAPEGGLLEEPGQGARMIQVEVGDQQQVDLHDGT
jgi:hypothetical protein